MILNESLTQLQQAVGRLNYLKFNMFNAISFTCVGDNILILFLLAMGCPPYFVTIVASFVYLSNIGMLVGKKMVLRRGAVGTMGRFWILRCFAALVVASSPFVSQFSHSFGIAVLMTGAFLFYFSGCGGAVAVQPIYGEITTPDNRGKYVASVFQCFMILSLLTMAVLVFVMRQAKSVQTYQVILLFGAVAGFIAAWFVWRVDESPMPRMSALQSLRDAARTIWHEPRMRKLLFANCAIYSVLALVVPVSMLALKKIYLIDDQTALLFVLVQMSGSLFISYISKLLAEHSGPRPLVILYSSVMLIVALLWIIAPAEFVWYYVALIFFINGFSAMGIPLSLSHYFLNAVPADKSVGTHLVITVTAGICAGISGGGIGSFMIKFLPVCGYDGMSLYKAYFVISIIIALAGLIVVSRLDKIRDWEVKKVLSLFFAARDIRTLLFLNSLDTREADATKESRSIEKLGVLGSELSERELLKSLDSPKFEVRARALMALSHIPFGEQTRKALLRELRDGIYSTASIAAQIVGDRRISEASGLLVAALESEDIYLRGKSMVALVQLRQKQVYPVIFDIFARSHNPRLLIQGAAALAMIGSPEALALLLNKAVVNIPPQVRAEILTAAAEIAGMGTAFYRFLKQKGNDYRIGLEFLKSVDKSPLDENLAGNVKAVLAGHEPPVALFETLCQAEMHDDNEVVKNVMKFLKQTSPEKINHLLLLCCLGILRKNFVI